jgi:uncharacterized protein YbjQ (UPF0145 family)
MTGPVNSAVPPEAAERISRLAAANSSGGFTSDLSVNEYLLVSSCGYEPVGYVMGTSIYHIGLQTSRWGTSQELAGLTQAMYTARQLAVDRMRAEAAALNADGVVGLHLELQDYAWGEDVLEFIAQGTAVRNVAQPGQGRAPDGRPFTCDLSGQDFFTLLQGGHFPISFVMGTSVYHVAHQGVMQSLRQIGQNQEMPQFTQAVYTARELAMNRMQAEADQLGATGIIGVRSEVDNRVWGFHATEFLAVGTAVRKTDPAANLDATLTLPLR